VREDADGEQDKKQKHLFLFLLGEKMWYFIISLMYTIILLALATSAENSVQVLKQMVIIAYLWLSMLLCIVLDEIYELKKRVRN
jgi:hypothetical protein